MFIFQPVKHSVLSVWRLDREAVLPPVGASGRSDRRPSIGCAVQGHITVLQHC